MSDISMMAKYHSRIMSSWAGKNKGTEENNRFFHYTVFSLLGIPTMLIFGLLHMSRQNFSMAALILSTGVCLGLGWYYLWKKGRSLLVYRINVAYFATMLFCTIIFAGKGEAILWCSILPLTTLLLLDRYEGILWSLGFLLVLLGIFTAGNTITHEYFFFAGFKIRFIMTYLIISTVAFWFESLRSRYRQGMEENEQLLKNKQAHLEQTVNDLTRTKQEKEEIIQELRSALEEVETLRGILPICSYCHKIRDDDGYWNRIERYLSQHADVSFSHGICPDCVDKSFATIHSVREKSVCNGNH